MVRYSGVDQRKPFTDIPRFLRPDLRYGKSVQHRTVGKYSTRAPLLGGTCVLEVMADWPLERNDIASISNRESRHILLSEGWVESLRVVTSAEFTTHPQAEEFLCRTPDCPAHRQFRSL